MSAAARSAARSDPTAPGVVFEGVSVGYDGAPVVRSVDLSVARGEIVGLIGPNGAGKSTMLKAITDAAEVLGGAVRLAGIPLAELDVSARARIVAVVPQALPTIFAFTAREFVEMGRHPHLARLERTSDADRAVIERAMEITDTLKLAGERADTLSGGDLQRLTLAQALAQEPEVLLLDEPTSHLDLNHRLQVLDLVRELADEGLAVLGVFHDLDLAARYGDRLGVVHGGRLGPCGTPGSVLTPELLKEVFSVRAVVGTDSVTGTVSVTPVLREQAARVPARGRVFVVGGAGSAAPLMRRLALAGFEISSGALNVGDVDQAVAEALGARYVRLPPFGEIDSAAVGEIGALAREADACIVAPVPFGRANLANLSAATTAGVPIGFLGGIGPERDFADGSALEMADASLADGGVLLETLDEAIAFVAGSWARSDA